MDKRESGTEIWAEKPLEKGYFEERKEVGKYPERVVGKYSGFV
jgi:hypothetical protein